MEGTFPAIEALQAETDRVLDGEFESDEIVIGFPGVLWESLEEYDQLETARDIDDSLLFAQGVRDYQVPPTELDRWMDGLDERPETSFETYDDFNHLFIPIDGPAVEYENGVRNNVDERVIEDVTAWIDALCCR